MLRRLAPLAAALLLATSAAADVAPWEMPKPASPAAPSGSSAPATTPAAPDKAAFGELLAQLLLKPEDADRMRKDTQVRRDEWLNARWEELPAHQQARVAFASEKLREGGSVATPRAITLLILGPPQQMHSEPKRSWKGESVERVDDLATLSPRLKGGKPSAPMTLTGELATEIWVYPGATVNDLRVITFVDEDGDGTFRFVSDRMAKAGEPLSSAPGVEPPSNLFPPLAAAGVIAPLPALTTTGLPVSPSAQFLKALAGRTFTRILIAIDPTDIELELSGSPDAFAATGEAFVRVEQGGGVLWQGQVKLVDVGATDSTPWLAELSVPLPPGKYQVTALVKDAQGAGGTKTWELEVPAFGGKLALSTPVVARASGDGLPKADGSGEDLLPFQIGNFIVRPMIGAQFKRGESAAFVVQVYGDAPAATIEYGLYRDGVWQSTLDPSPIKSLPSTQITVQEITEDFTDGPYELRATVKNSKDATDTVKASFPFRVRG